MRVEWKSAALGAALTVGPFCTYLVWALLSRRPLHICLAVALNAALWIGAPAYLAHHFLTK